MDWLLVLLGAGGVIYILSRTASPTSGGCSSPCNQQTQGGVCPNVQTPPCTQPTQGGGCLFGGCLAGLCLNGTCPVLGNCCGITSDQSTWPSGDRIWDICQAIAIAEGANIPGSFPDRYNNPGDLSTGDAPQFSTVVNTTDNEVVVMFPDKQTGWQYLYNKVNRIVTGGSSAYPANLSFNQVGVKWASPTTGATWANNVANQLGVDPNSTPEQYVCCAT
jgi:hypothetical protein